MTKNLTIRLDDEIYKKLEEYASRHGMSRAQVIVEALNNLFNPIANAKDVKEVSLKEIVVKYKTTCVKCGRVIDVGEIAYWGRGVGVVCYDCYVKANQKITGFDAKKLVKMYREIRKLKVIKSELQKEVDLLADKLNVYELLDELSSRLRSVEGKLEYIITSLLSDEQDKQQLQQVYKEVKDSIDRLNEIMYGLRNIIIKTKKTDVKRSIISNRYYTGT